MQTNFKITLFLDISSKINNSMKYYMITSIVLNPQRRLTNSFPLEIPMMGTSGANWGELWDKFKRIVKCNYNKMNQFSGSELVN